MGLKLPPHIPPLYSSESTSLAEKIVYVRLFALGSAATWLIAEYDPSERIAFGYADLFGEGSAGGAEWGYICLEELEEIEFMGIRRVEVDRSFVANPFSNCVRNDGTII
jgi:hypothetical protein